MKRSLMAFLILGLLLVAIPLASVASAQEPTEEPANGNGSTAAAARILTTNLRADPREVESGENITITGEVRNIGDAAGSEILELVLDGNVVETLTVSLDPGESKTFAFSRPSGAQGTHLLSLGETLERYTVGVAEEPKFRQGPVVRLRPLNDEITNVQDGLVEIFISNPRVNDVTVEAEVFISVPSGIHVYGESFGAAAAAGTVRGDFVMAPGSSRTIPIYIKAENLGTFFVHFSGQYWPEGNKDGFQPVSLTAPIKVSAVSPDPRSAVPTNPDLDPSSVEQNVADNNESDGPTTEVQPSPEANVSSGDTPWYQEPLFFVIVSLAGASIIVFLGRTVVTMSRD